MTFDMTKCKIRDKLKTRNGNKVELTSICNPNHTDDYVINDYYSVNSGGYWDAGEVCSDDIIGFWEEEEEQSSDDNDYPAIEVRKPHIAKIITYRVHFNEMFHRDLSEEEAVAIYQQLKTLLGEK